MLYEVLAKCGHVGNRKYVVKAFAVEAMDGKEAAQIVRHMPRVKHHHKDAIIRVVEIDNNRYAEIKTMQDADPYFSCKCVQDQRKYSELDIYDEKEDKRYPKKEDSRKDVYIGKIRLRNPKSNFNKIYFEKRVA